MFQFNDLTKLVRLLSQRLQAALNTRFSGRRHAQVGYGLMMLIIFITSTVLIGASIQMVLGSGTSAYMGTEAQDYMAAKQVAQSGMEVVLADIQSSLNAGTTVDTSYTYSSAAHNTSISMPNDPASLGGGTTQIGPYTATITSARGNTYLVNVVATVNSTTYSYSKLFTMGRVGGNTVDNLAGGTANAMYGMRKLRSAYGGSAIRVRRSIDDTEQDIGFDGNGNLDMDSLKTFLSVSNPPLTVPTVAFGLRRLRSAYTGSAINVRRSSDSTTQDIGFNSAGDLDVNALMNFVGAGTGYVTKWYDQSGNGTDASQATAANQPTIVVAGVLNTINNRPSILYDGVSDYLSFTRTISDDFTMMACYNAIAGVNTYTGHLNWYEHAGIIDGEVAGTVNDFGISVDSSGYLYAGVGNPDTTIYSVTGYGTNISPTGINDGRMHWVAMSRKMSTGHFFLYHDRFMYAGSDSNTPNTSSLTAPTNLTIGAVLDQPNYLNGSVNEVIIYNSKLSTTTLRTLERNEAWYFNMPTFQWTGWQYPLNGVPGATAAYGLRLLRSAYFANPMIKVRRSSDNTTQDIATDGCCQLDVKSLLSFVGNGSGYIDTLYDQTGNGNNLTQATAANQPRIVNAGVLDMMNGKPAIYFTGSSYLTNSTVTNSTASLTALALFNVPSGNTGYNRVMSLYANGHVDWSNTDSVAAIEAATNYLRTQRSGLTDTGISYAYGDTMLATVVFDGSNQYVYKDGLLGGTQASTASFNIQNIRLGSSEQLGGTEYFQGYLSEAYLYPTAVSLSLRTWLQQDILQYNSYNAPAAYVTKWYDQSVNGYDAVQVSPVLQPTLILPRTGVLNSHPTINFNGTQYLYTTGGMPTNSDYSKVAVFSYFANGTGNIMSDTSNIHALYMNSGNNLYLFQSGAFAGAGANYTMTFNTNYAICGTFVTSSGAGKTYVFNSQAGSGTRAIANTSSGIQFGAHSGLNNTLYGSISEAMVFSRVLTAADRTAIYNDERGYYAAQ